ncbi:hypothetical protein C9374_002248 [Naegleria lovaniensis]|uniref:non-specific serine/threonine protein kinase n=1 Tax=Naegleria lovaniensis TaxID=51637 RepID=A0AA88GUQ3_NAELO|nr:uncharacterized protein C9374_002248 [Naegleria lovaniensis]KAG2386504.1 hypothetical protein C9374_002248 [Naegleria lovaniensis]
MTKRKNQPSNNTSSDPNHHHDPTNPNEIIIIDNKYQFRKSDTLGRGGYGVVYKGFRSSFGDMVAIKEIPLKKHQALKDIQNEINLLSKLDHERIVKYIDHHSTNQAFYIIMEYLENGSLASLVKKYKVTEDVVSSYIKQVLEGLVYLHKQGFIHRDIKGDNVLLTRGGAVKLADFGVSASLSLIRKEDVSGTPHWMAPEAISQSGVSEKSDIWSVGCLTIELLTGFPPYYTENIYRAMFRIVNDDHPPIPSCSSAAEDFLMLCFKKEPKFRPTAQTLLSHPWIAKKQEKENQVPSFINRSSFDSDFSFDSWSSLPSKEKKMPTMKTVTEVNGKVNLEKFKEGSSDDDIDFEINTSTLGDGLELKPHLLKSESNSSQTFESWDDIDFKVDKVAEIQTILDEHISKLSPNHSPDEILKTCADISKLKSLADNDDFIAALNRTLSKRSLISVLQILDKTEFLEEETVITYILQLLNELLSMIEPQYKEQLCLIGAFPKVTKLSSNSFSAQLRYESIRFLHSMCIENKTNLRMFIASEGVKTLVKFLNTKKTQDTTRFLPKLAFSSSIDSSDNIQIKTVFQSIDLIEMVLKLQTSQTDRNDFCRLFSMHDFLGKIAAVFTNFLEDFRDVETFLGIAPLSITSPSFKTVVLSKQLAFLKSEDNDDENAFSTVKVIPKNQNTDHNVKKEQQTTTLSSSDDEDSSDDDWDSSSSSSDDMKFSTVIYGGDEDKDSSSDDDDEDDNNSLPTTVIIKQNSKNVNFSEERKNLNLLKTYIDKIISMLLMFSDGDSEIHVAFSNKTVIDNLVASFKYLSDSQKSQVITSLRFLAFNTNTHELLTSTNILNALVKEFSLVVYRSDVKVLESVNSKIYNQVVNSLYSLCVFNEQRLDEISLHGCIELLSHAVMSQLPLKEMVLRLLFGMAVRNCSNETKKRLLEENGLEAYFFILRHDKAWVADVFSALSSLLYNEFIKYDVENSISNHLDIFVQLFEVSKDLLLTIESTVPGFVTLLKLSDNITSVCKQNLDLITNLCQSLSAVVQNYSSLDEDTDLSPLLRNFLYSLSLLLPENSALTQTVTDIASRSLSELLEYAQHKNLYVIQEQITPLLKSVKTQKKRE